MKVPQAISARRSIRKFKDTPISREILEQIITAGIMAPSTKNMQPWKIVAVVSENERAEMAKVMRRGLQEAVKENELNPEVKKYALAARFSIDVMAAAPAVLFVYNTGSDINDYFTLSCHQSVSAMIENMLIAATGLGVGSLWVCDIYSCYDSVTKWLDTDGQLLAAVCLGYAAEAPSPRPRKSIGEVVIWR